MKLLIRVVVGMLLLFAVLAVFYQPACSCTSHRAAFRTIMKADLRDLVDSQVAYRRSHPRYAPTLPLLGFTASKGAHIWITGADTAGFFAEASHDSARGARCAVAIGPFLTDSVHGAGEPVCLTR